MILSSLGIIKSAISSLMTGLYAVYKGENNANDSLGNYNGTAQGGLTYSSGISGNAFIHNGTNAHVLLPNNMFNSFTGDFSIEGWIYLSRADIQQAICGAFNNISNTNYYGWILWCNVNSLRFGIYNGSNSALNLDLTGVTLLAGVWQHVAITRKGNTGTKMYLNGVMRNSNSSAQNPVYHPSLNYATIGTYYFNGSPDLIMSNNSKIDELYFYNIELTQDEITSLYNAGVGKFYPTF